jgi:hypothetical protein
MPDQILRSGGSGRPPAFKPSRGRARGRAWARDFWDFSRPVARPSDKSDLSAAAQILGPRRGKSLYGRPQRSRNR